jgi:hypothetical protein
MYQNVSKEEYDYIGGSHFKAPNEHQKRQMSIKSAKKELKAQKKR